MKIRFCAALLIAVMTLSILTGCTAQSMSMPQADQPESITREVMAEIPDETVPLAATPTEPVPTRPVESDPTRPPETTPKLTAEEAKAIALEHAGFTAEQVRYLHAEPELRDRVPHYDVEFQEGRWEYEYEIHAETGKILSFEKDD